MEQGYKPRVDLIWYLDLREIGTDLGKIGRYLPLEMELTKEVNHFPIVAFEIEATDTTSKTMQADIANLASMNTPFGFLVVNVEKGGDLYRRGNRIIRTFRQLYGSLNFLCLDKSQIQRLLDTEFSRERQSVIKKVPKSKGAGGESGWARVVRGELDDFGQRHGFHVEHDWVIPELSHEFQRKKKVWEEIPPELGRVLGSEITLHPRGEVKKCEKWNQFFIRPKLDVAWCICLPPQILSFVKEIEKLDKDFVTHTPFLHGKDLQYPLFAFEIEGKGGKHAGGGILNLAKYSSLGYVIVRNSEVKKRVEMKLNTYRVAMGLHNVKVIEFDKLGKG